MHHAAAARLGAELPADDQLRRRGHSSLVPGLGLGGEAALEGEDVAVAGDVAAELEPRHAVHRGHARPGVAAQRELATRSVLSVRGQSGKCLLNTGCFKTHD